VAKIYWGVTRGARKGGKHIGVCDKNLKIVAKARNQVAKKIKFLALLEVPLLDSVFYYQQQCLLKDRRKWFNPCITIY
jgi:hypothetical protein